MPTVARRSKTALWLFIIFIIVILMSNFFLSVFLLLPPLFYLVDIQLFCLPWCSLIYQYIFHGHHFLWNPKLNFHLNTKKEQNKLRYETKRGMSHSENKFVCKKFSFSIVKNRDTNRKFSSFFCPLVSRSLLRCVYVSSSHRSPSFLTFLFAFFVPFLFFLLLFTFHAHIYGHIAMDLVRSVRFHEIKSSCCRYCICVKAFYSMLVLYVFAWNRSNSNRVVFYGITLSICYENTLSSPLGPCAHWFYFCWSHGDSFIFFFSFISLNLMPLNDFRWHFMRISILC